MACLAAACVAIPAVLWRCMPGLSTYGGLSGLDSALFGLVAVTLLQEKARAREWAWVAGAGALLAAFIVKTCIEFATGAAVFVSADDALTPVPLAHVAGGLVGALCGLLPPSSGVSSRTEP